MIVPVLEQVSKLSVLCCKLKSKQVMRFDCRFSFYQKGQGKSKWLFAPWSMVWFLYEESLVLPG